MKILILVLSSLKEPYNKMYNTQRKTWDSVHHDNIDVVYYFCDDYNKMHVPFIETVKNIWCGDWDLIFRTNSSSYVDKHLLYEYAKDLPKERIWISSPDGQMSGCGFFMSRDYLSHLISSPYPDTHDAEDMYIAHKVNELGVIPNAGKRSEYNHIELLYDKCYHIRCKHEEDRDKDVEAMNHIFNTIR